MFIEKELIRKAIIRNRLPGIKKEEDERLEDILYEVFSQAKYKQENVLATKTDINSVKDDIKTTKDGIKDDIKMVIDMTNKRFEAIKDDINIVIEMTNNRFEDMYKYMDKRFEAVDKRFEAVDKRFEDMNISIAQRFEDMNISIAQRFEDMNKRFNSLQWLIGIGFGFLTILISVLKIFV